MPTLKRSPTATKKLGGCSEEQTLYQALTLLFFLKSKEYQKTHPDFSAPCADEFLSHARCVSDTAFDKSRKAIAVAKYNKGASISTVRKIISARHLPSIDTEEKPAFTKFLHFLVPLTHDTLCHQILQCIQIAVYALHVYTYINVCMEAFELYGAVVTATQLARHATEQLSAEEHVRHTSSVLLRFCTSYMPTIVDVKDVLVERSYEYMKDHVYTAMLDYVTAKKITEPMDSRRIVAMVLGGFDRFFVANTHMKKFTRPMIVALEHVGIETRESSACTT